MTVAHVPVKVKAVYFCMRSPHPRTNSFTLGKLAGSGQFEDPCAHSYNCVGKVDPGISALQLDGIGDYRRSCPQPPWLDRYLLSLGAT